MLGHYAKTQRKLPHQNYAAEQLDLAQSISNTLATIEKLAVRKDPKDRRQAWLLLDELEAAIEDGLPKGFDVDKFDQYIHRLEARLTV